jgi:hypothetical protein
MQRRRSFDKGVRLSVLCFLSVAISGGTPRHTQLLDFLSGARKRLTVMQSRRNLERRVTDTYKIECVLITGYLAFI